MALGCLLAAGLGMPRECLSLSAGRVSKLANGRLGRPEEAIDVALGCLLSAGLGMPRECVSVGRV